MTFLQRYEQHVAKGGTLTPTEFIALQTRYDDLETRLAFHRHYQQLFFESFNEMPTDVTIAIHGKLLQLVDVTSGRDNEQAIIKRAFQELTEYHATQAATLTVERDKLLESLQPPVNHPAGA